MTEGIRVRLNMHMKLAKGGSIYIYDAVDYPGIGISRNRKSRDEPLTRKIVFGENEYPTIAAAIEAWQEDAREKAAPKHETTDHAARCSTHGHIRGDDDVCASCGATA